MIEIRELTKRYGDVTVVDRLSFTAEAGRVTGLLGPEGAGKSTTLRLLLGLSSPTAGSAAIGGREFRDHPPGPREVGALLDNHSVYCRHVGNTARECLTGLARRYGLPGGRVDRILEDVGLTEADHRRVGTFSLGMRQRLGVAFALLADPPVLVFDEPLNGLDHRGLVWARNLFRRLADEGRTVLVSGQPPIELAGPAEDLVVVAGGRRIEGKRAALLVGRDSRPQVHVRTPDVAVLTALLAEEGASVVVNDDQSLTVTGLTAQGIGEVAFLNVVPVYELTPAIPGR
ncbi:ATP-binding cassette domain-containing protein [Streptomyces sp. Li-HN-5-11]|uniref:ATP-binding cassette domain-containing protein n=1 Tax=Streptomyces sp. Li-HN-5-11 TaxID=3075432 RepID=UPI0028A8DE72|nr:ATP-binding cassette domain-containing protein [Streptomyces sp. Li-HN-5-11]WNM31448.1 ATP-binding cassette domain-containing protein [Streptomyces sp. Li-HN-5-11]